MVFDPDKPIRFKPEDAEDATAYVKKGRVYAEVVASESKVGDYGPGIKLTWQALYPRGEAGNLVGDTLWFAGKGLSRTKLVMRRLGLEKAFDGGSVSPSDFEGIRAYVNVTPKQVGDKTYGNVDYDGYQVADDILTAPPDSDLSPTSYKAKGSKAEEDDTPF
ncbi:MAG TPA: hypothetical protein VNA25_05000 [Phycisphaerae bacterium]|nr:hypothetical protein [Phycisphaerae bacterium]